MGLMNLQTAQPFTPPESLSLRSEVTAAMWYPLHGNANAAGGFGHPNLTVNGAVGTLWSATWGGATPDGATHYLTAATGNAVLQELFDLRDLNGQLVLIGFELTTDGNLAGNENVLYWGASNGSAGQAGGWGVSLNATEQLAVNFRGAEAANESGGAVSGTAMASTNRWSVVVSLLGTGASTATIGVLRHELGVGDGSAAQSTGVSTLGTDGIAPPGIHATYALTLFARRATAAYDRFLGATAGSNAVIGNVWAARLSAPVSGIEQACLDAMKASPREFPWAALGAS